MNISKTLLKVGAVGVALAIEYDRTGVFTFLVPAVIGIFILISSWVSNGVYPIPWNQEVKNESNVNYKLQLIF